MLGQCKLVRCCPVLWGRLGGLTGQRPPNTPITTDSCGQQVRTPWQWALRSWWVRGSVSVPTQQMQAPGLPHPVEELERALELGSAFLLVQGLGGPAAGEELSRCTGAAAWDCSNRRDHMTSQEPAAPPRALPAYVELDTRELTAQSMCLSFHPCTCSFSCCWLSGEAGSRGTSLQCTATRGQVI